MGLKMSFRGFMGLWWVMGMEKSSNRLRSEGGDVYAFVYVHWVYMVWRSPPID